MPGINKVFIVTTPGMVEHGYVDTVLDELKRRPNEIEYSLFSDVETDPTTDTVEKGVRQMRAFKPDTIIALGGGSPLDAAKNMWLFYEDPTPASLAQSRSSLISENGLTVSRNLVRPK